MPKRAPKKLSPRAQTMFAIMKIAEGLADVSEAFEAMQRRNQLPKEFCEMSMLIRIPLTTALETFQRTAFPGARSKVTFTN
jgi:hypothetical protein